MHRTRLTAWCLFCFRRGTGPDSRAERGRRAHVAPGRGTGVRTGPVVPHTRQLLQREQAAQLAVRQGARDAPGPGLERGPHAHPDHRAVPVRPPADPVEVPGHAHHGQVPAAVGPARRPVGVHRAQPTLHVPGQEPVEDAAGEVDARGHLSARGPRHARPASGLQRSECSVKMTWKFLLGSGFYSRFLIK